MHPEFRFGKRNTAEELRQLSNSAGSGAIVAAAAVTLALAIASVSRKRPD
jgi:hypothetical protein